MLRSLTMPLSNTGRLRGDRGAGTGAALEPYGEHPSAQRLIRLDLAVDVPVLWHHLVEKSFDPARFVSMMQCGVFDGRLHSELERLSREQLEQVAILLAQRNKRDKALVPRPDRQAAT